jgi:hypothetical protein
LAVVSADGDHLGHSTASSHARDVHNQVDRECNRLARAAMGQAHIRCQHAVREARERLLGRVRVNRAQATEVACVERLIAIYQPTIRATDGSGHLEGDAQMSEELTDEVLEILERSGAREATEAEARRYRDLAFAEARSLPVPEEGVVELRALVESMISA